MATADFDNDGGLDIVTDRLNSNAKIFKNEASKPRIAVRLKGKRPNTQAIGAKVKLEGVIVQQKEIASGGDYVSGSDPMVIFATPEDTVYTLTVTWPNGKRQTITNIKANRIYEISEPDSFSSSDSNWALDSIRTIFDDISDRISYKHLDKDFSDFRLQPLLPIKLSNLGPGVAWLDFDHDGDDDLFVGNGKGGQLGGALKI